jgi:hypothetical protein
MDNKENPNQISSEVEQDCGNKEKKKKKKRRRRIIRRRRRRRRRRSRIIIIRISSRRRRRRRGRKADKEIKLQNKCSEQEKRQDSPGSAKHENQKDVSTVRRI